MKFHYIDMLRYNDAFDEFLFKNEDKKYLKHLSGINFDKNPSLLRYFGRSYFHDAEVKSINLLPKKHLLSFELISKNVLEDINAYREKKKMDLILEEAFNKNPIVFYCQFQGVSLINCSIDFILCNTIMDTQITQYDEDSKMYYTTISFWKGNEIEFSCNRSSVKIDKDLVRKYTDNKLSTIPFCEQCKSKLLSAKQLKAMISE